MLESSSLSKFRFDIDPALCQVLHIFDANPNMSKNFSISLTPVRSWDKACVSTYGAPILGKPPVREYCFLCAARIVIVVDGKAAGLGICGYPNGPCVVDTRAILQPLFIRYRQWYYRSLKQTVYWQPAYPLVIGWHKVSYAHTCCSQDGSAIK